MAFFGILILAWVFWMILIFVICVIVFVFIPSLIVAIINLILGIKHHWPKHNVILLSVFGGIVVLLFIIGELFALLLTFAHSSNTTSSESVETVTLLLSALLC